MCRRLDAESEVKGDSFLRCELRGVGNHRRKVAVTLASLTVLRHLLNTAGRDFDDDLALAEKFRRDAPYHLLKEVLIPADKA